MSQPSTPGARPHADTDASWQSRAACHGETARFFYAPAHFERKPEKDMRENAARSVCRSCPVVVDCLEYALAVDERHGIWGGLNELQRRRLIRRRMSASA